MLTNKKKSIKLFTMLIFGLLIFSNIYGVIGTNPSGSSSDENDGDTEGLLDTEVPIFDDTPIIDTEVEPIDFTGEEVFEPDSYDRNAIEWHPIEESLKDVQFNAETAGVSIATASYDAVTGVESIINPQFLPSSESMPELSVVEPYAGLLAGTDNSESVIGPDGRYLLNNQVYPGRTIVKLYISASDGSNWVGSGAIVDDFHVLTAGHCAFLPDNGGWASSIEIVPGMDLFDNPSDPYGHAWTVGMRSYTGWTVSESSQHDWALLTLDRNVGAYTGWMGRKMAGETSSIYTNIMYVAGYPADIPVDNEGTRLYADSDWGDGATYNNHFYWADTAGGMSGGPVWEDDAGWLYIMTVHAYGRAGTDSNFGTRLNADKYNRLYDWLHMDTAPTDKADLIDRGSAYDSMTGGPWQAGVTDVTINHDTRNVGTASSGTYYVHYYASTNDYISTYDYYIGTSTAESTGAFGFDDVTFTGQLPSDIPEGNYYIGWIIDQADAVDEFDETNNVAVYAYQRWIDGAPPPPNYIEVQVNASITPYVPLQSVYVKTYVSGTSSLIDTGYTDVNGFYNITQLPVGTYDVKVSKVGYKGDMRTETIHILPKGFDDDYLWFYLDPYGPDTSWIEVNVKDSVTINPISSAYVTVTNMSSGLVIKTGYTNSAGFYNATGLFIGWYEIAVSRASYKDQTKQNYINWNHDDDYLTFYMKKMPFNSGYIEVRTINETGGPLSGVLVKTYNNSGATTVDSGYSDANGFYNVTGLIIGLYQVNVTYLGWQEQSKSDYINWYGDDDYLSFWMVPNPPDSGYIDVNVKDSASYSPIYFALVTVTNQSSGLVIQTGYTDTSGFYKVMNLTVGWYTIDVTKAGYHGESQQDYINWAGDNDYLTFYMDEMPPDSGYIEVLVKDDDTLAPIQGAFVACYYSNGTYFGGGYTDATGFYNITGLYIGWYDVVVTYTDYGGQSKSDYINWNGDDDYLYFYLILAPPGWIEVTVLDMYNYNPIPDAYVRCYNYTSGELVDEGYTDANGFYNITGLLLGYWTVNVSHPAFMADSQLDYINWRGDDDYLTFYLDTTYEPFTGSIAIFRDNFPWNLNVTEPLLINHSIPYDIYNSLDFGSADLSMYQKVIIPSDQSQAYYNRFSSNVSWFESYIGNGGILQFHGADVPAAWHFGTWQNLPMPGDFNHTFVLSLENVTINLGAHPLLLNPFLVEDDELDNWNQATHGYFTSYPANTKEILLEGTTLNPVLIEFKYGAGFVIATVQPLEWNENRDYTRLLENMILYDPTYYDNSINVTSPISSEYWETLSMQTITWDSSGTITDVKIELYENGAFVMELAASTPDDGSFSWTVPMGLTDSVLYQIRISDADYAATEDYSDNFEIEDPRTITVVVPDSTTTWTMGDTESINWTSTGIIANVKIDLYASSFLIMELAANTPNDGTFEWLLPDTLVNYTVYVIRISDVVDLTIYDESDPFSITSPDSPPIAGYDLLIMISVLLGVSVIVIRKRHKR